MRGNGRLIPAKPHVDLLHAKQWRQTEFDAGRSSSLFDYFAAHGICPTCSGEGVHMVGWSDPVGERELRATRELGCEQLPVYDVCSLCGGSGASVES